MGAMAGRKRLTESIWCILERWLREADEPREPAGKRWYGQGQKRVVAAPKPQTPGDQRPLMYSGRRMSYSELSKLAGWYGMERPPQAEGGTLDHIKHPKGVENWTADISLDMWPARWGDMGRAVQDSVGSQRGVDTHAGVVPVMPSRKAGGFRTPAGQLPTHKGEPARTRSHLGKDVPVNPGDVKYRAQVNPRTGRPDPIKSTMRVVEPAMPYGGDLNVGSARLEDLYDVVIAARIDREEGVAEPVAVTWLPINKGVPGGAAGPEGGAPSDDEQEMELLDMVSRIKGAQKKSPERRPPQEMPKKGGDYTPPERQGLSIKAPMPQSSGRPEKGAYRSVDVDPNRPTPQWKKQFGSKVRVSEPDVAGTAGWGSEWDPESMSYKKKRES